MRPTAPALLAVLVLIANLVGCAHKAAAPPASRVVAPIAADAVAQLLGAGHAHVDTANMYGSASPPQCRGLVLELDPPFLMARNPAALASGVSPNPADLSHPLVVEIAAVYHDDFNPEAAVAEAAKTRADCVGALVTGSTQGGGNSTFQLSQQTDSGSPNILLWSISAVGKAWYCDNAFIAARNAAVEITSCYATPGSVQAVAQNVLHQIEELARRQPR